jgi:hypothetical protein
MESVISDAMYSEDKNPKWAYWRQFKFVSFEDAIYLSLDMNPHMIPWMLQETCHLYCKEIDERTEIAYNWADSQDWFIEDIDGIQSRNRVDLKGFSNWICSEMNWEVPPDFSAIAGAKDRINIIDSGKSPGSKEFRNDLKLIGALYEIILQKGIYQSEEALKAYLEDNYGELKGMGHRTLDTKLSAAKKAIAIK